jgi:hypothetical protein
MGGLKDYERGRNDGLALAGKIVRRGGIEELEKEMKFRGVTGIHTAIAKKELVRWYNKVVTPNRK